MSEHHPFFQRVQNIDVGLAVVSAFLDGIREVLEKSSDLEVKSVGGHYIKSAADELKTVRASLSPIALHARSDLSSVELVLLSAFPPSPLSIYPLFPKTPTPAFRLPVVSRNLGFRLLSDSQNLHLSFSNNLLVLDCFFTGFGLTKRGLPIRKVTAVSLLSIKRNSASTKPRQAARILIANTQ